MPKVAISITSADSRTICIHTGRSLKYARTGFFLCSTEAIKTSTMQSAAAQKPMVLLKFCRWTKGIRSASPSGIRQFVTMHAQKRKPSPSVPTSGSTSSSATMVNVRRMRKSRQKRFPLSICSHSPARLYTGSSHSERMMKRPFSKPQTIYPQLAPCQRPVVNHVKSSATVGGRQLTACLPSTPRQDLASFRFQEDTPMGKYTYFLNHWPSEICHLRQYSDTDLAKNGRLKFSVRRTPSISQKPHMISI